MTTTDKKSTASGVQKDTSVAKVSYWHIPGGCDYQNARATVLYFDDMEEAKAFADKNAYPPEMAILIPLENK